MAHVTLRNGGTNDHRTPLAFFRAAERLAGGFDVDAAATAGSRLCGNYMGPDHEAPWRRNALFRGEPWARGPGSKIWLNPPYGKHLLPFSDRAVFEVEEDPSTRVWVLIPAKPDTRWFNLLISRAIQVYFCRKRIPFNDGEGKPILDKHGKQTAAAFPSALIELAAHGGSPRVIWGWDWTKQRKAVA
jgi:hypothetical protein